MSNALDRLIAERRQREMESRKIYGEIYRDLTGTEGTIEVSVGEMPVGKSFFTFQTTAEWIGANVKLVGEMEMFNEDDNDYRRIGDDYGNIEITSDNIELIRQRPVDFSRAIGIAKYLLMHPYHNLPDLVLVVSAPWVDKRDAPQWQDGRAIVDSCSVDEINELTDKVLLRLGRMGDNDRYSIYALDGQHRLIGIKAALEMLETGVLHPRKKDGTPATGRNNDEHLEDWLDEVEGLGITKKDVMKFRTERVGIKLVPAVCKGETWEEAVQRVASIFKAFNTTSVAVPKGAATAMDQEDGFAIAARRTYKEADFLKDLKSARPTRLSPTNNTIAAKSTVLTTLATMKTMAEVYLSNKYGEWRRPKKKNMMGQPPSEDLVNQAVEELVALWDSISTLPSMRSIEPWDLLPEEVKNVTPFREPRNVAEMRRFPTDDYEGEAHMLFRPLGQQALAQAAGVVVNNPINPMSLQEIFGILGRYDASGGFCMVKKSNPWWGVLYDQAREKIITSGANLAADLLEYMLTGDSTRGVESLRLAFASARKSSSEGLYVDLNGNDVPLEDLKLPARLH